MPHPEVVYGGTVRPPLPQAVTASGRQGHLISARFWKGHGGVGTRGSRKGWCRLRDSNTRPSHYECDALPTELRRHLRPDPPASGSGGSEEHTSELQSLMRISYAVICLHKKN